LLCTLTIRSFSHFQAIVKPKSRRILLLRTGTPSILNRGEMDAAILLPAGLVIYLAIRFLLAMTSDGHSLLLNLSSE
jgi:hypothetical protein